MRNTVSEPDAPRYFEFECVSMHLTIFHKVVATTAGFVSLSVGADVC
jgi:hypothetical protein